MTQLQEREQKFDVPGSMELPDTTGVLVDGERAVLHERVVLDALYFDTDDRTLLNAGVTVRRRSGGSDAGWHLKEPEASPSTRRELQVPMGEGDALPEAIVARLADRFGKIELRPILVVRTERTACDVLHGADLLAEIARDDVVAVDLTTLVGTAWPEVEIESHADAATTERLTGALVAAGATPSQYRSKFAHGLRPRSGQRSPKGVGLVVARVRGQLAALVVAEADVRLDVPDSVHQMRVASRRLRSCLRTFRAAFVNGGTDHLEAELAWLAALLGGARDAEVVEGQIADDLSQVAPENLLGPVAYSLKVRSSGELATARAALDGALDSSRYGDLLESLIGFANDPPLRDGQRSRRWLDRRFAKAVDKTDALVAAAAKGRAGERDAALHRARKSAKRVRYAAETLSPLDSKRFARTAKRYEKIQTELGTHHDAVVTRSIYREEGARVGVDSGQNGFSYGVLFAIEDERARRALAEFDRIWKRPRRATTARS